MITAEELVFEIDTGEEQSNFRLGTVFGLFENETAKIQFDGEDVPSEKEYAYLASYIPKKDDRVLLGVLSGTYVVLGKVNYQVEPDVEEEIDRYLFDLKKVIMQKGLSVAGDTDLENLTANGTAIDGDLGVSGTMMAQEISSSGDISSGSAITASGDISSGNEVSGESGSFSRLDVYDAANFKNGATVTGRMTASSVRSTGAVTGSSASISGEASAGSFDTSGPSSVGGRLSAKSTFAHTGLRWGIFGKTPVTRPGGNGYTTLSSNASLEDVISKLNLYINLLKTLGISS